MTQHRIAALRRSLESEQLDALLITSIPNLRYLTGFSGSAAIGLVSHSDVLLVTDFRYATQVQDEVTPGIRIEIDRKSFWERLWATLPGLPGVERIGFESAHVSHQEFLRLRNGAPGGAPEPMPVAGPGGRWQWRPTTDLVEQLRVVKDPDELAAIRRACEIATEALDVALPQVRPGMTELAFAGILERALREGGSEGFPFETTVAAGPRSALPHARATSQVLRAGDFLLVDFGAVFRGYCSDISRTFVLGKATPEQREVYDVVRSAQAVAVSGLRAGMTGRDADALARSYIERAGWGEAFGHSLGHGIGLEVHEAPRLARTAEGALNVGAVVTVEPGVYRAGWGGVRIEDDVLLGTAGPELLTHYPRELVELA